LNLTEIVSYLVGLNRGASDLLTGTAMDSGLSPNSTALLQSVGPAVSLLEQFTLTSPILFGIACRTPSAQRFGDAIAELHARRKASMLNQAAAVAPALQPLVDGNAGTASKLVQLQQEINKRDQMLVDAQKYLTHIHDHLQAEVNKRDQMLTELQRELNELRR
jgi:hypothetical protein